MCDFCTRVSLSNAYILPTRALGEPWSLEVSVKFWKIIYSDGPFLHYVQRNFEMLLVDENLNFQPILMKFKHRPMPGPSHKRLKFQPIRTAGT